MEKDAATAANRMLEVPAVKKFNDRLGTENEKEQFRRHLRKYVNMYLPDAPFEITTTNRYTIDTQEATVTARRNIKKGELIKHLTGIQVSLTRDEEKNLDRTRRDFSIVMSSRKRTPSLFLGPARFANHDCSANANLTTRGPSGMVVIAVKDIAVDDEITVSYGDDYFGIDNQECLCETCEKHLRNGWSPKADHSNAAHNETPETRISEGIGSPHGVSKARNTNGPKLSTTDSIGQSTSPSRKSNSQGLDEPSPPGTPPARAIARRPRALKTQPGASSLTQELYPEDIINEQFKDSERKDRASMTSSARSSSPKSVFDDSPYSTSETSLSEGNSSKEQRSHPVIANNERELSYLPRLDITGPYDRDAGPDFTPEYQELQERFRRSVLKLSEALAEDRRPEASPEVNEDDCPQDQPTMDIDRQHDDTQRTRSGRRCVESEPSPIVPPPSCKTKTKGRYPGDYTLTRALLCTPYSRWVICRVCDAHFVQADAYQTRWSCPRCERHSKLYGYQWPKTDKSGKYDTEERILDPRNVNRFVSADEEKLIRKGKKTLKDLIAEVGEVNEEQQPPESAASRLRKQTLEPKDYYGRRRRRDSEPDADQSSSKRLRDDESEDPGQSGNIQLASEKKTRPVKLKPQPKPKPYWGAWGHYWDYEVVRPKKAIKAEDIIKHEGIKTRRNNKLPLVDLESVETGQQSLRASLPSQHAGQPQKTMGKPKKPRKPWAARNEVRKSSNGPVISRQPKNSLVNSKKRTKFTSGSVKWREPKEHLTKAKEETNDPSCPVMPKKKKQSMTNRKEVTVNASGPVITRQPKAKLTGKRKYVRSGKYVGVHGRRLAIRAASSTQSRASTSGSQKHSSKVSAHRVSKRKEAHRIKGITNISTDRKSCKSSWQSSEDSDEQASSTEQCTGRTGKLKPVSKSSTMSPSKQSSRSSDFDPEWEAQMQVVKNSKEKRRKPARSLSAMSLD